MSINLIFSSFYYSSQLSEDLNLIEKHIYELEKKSLGREKSNSGGWQSNDLTINDISTEMHSLIKNIVNNAAPVIEYCKFEGKIGLHNIWVNINRANDFNRSHVHPNTLISGTFYVKAHASCGRLIFENPNESLRYYLNTGVKDFNEFNSPEWSFIPSPNTVVYFPSYLRHYVEPNKSGEDRISIAFNLGLIN